MKFVIWGLVLLRKLKLKVLKILYTRKTLEVVVFSDDLFHFIIRKMVYSCQITCHGKNLLAYLFCISIHKRDKVHLKTYDISRPPSKLQSGLAFWLHRVWCGRKNLHV